LGRRSKFWIEHRNFGSNIEILVKGKNFGSNIETKLLVEGPNFRSKIELVIKHIFSSETETSITKLGLAAYSGLWSFAGWTDIALITEELIEPSQGGHHDISFNF